MTLMVLAAVVPRVALAAIWITTGWVDLAFDGWILPLLGIVFVPCSTLVFLGLTISNGGATSRSWLWVLAAGAAVDLAGWGLYRKVVRCGA